MKTALRILLLAFTLVCHALTPAELADSYHARGLAAEKRGDFDVAENCYTLALRTLPGHPGSTASMANLVKQRPVLAPLQIKNLEQKAKTQILPTVQFQRATIEEAIEDFRMKTGIRFHIDLPRPNMASISLDLKDVPLAEALRYVTELSITSYHFEADGIHITNVPFVAGKVFSNASLHALDHQKEPTASVDKSPAPFVWERQKSSLVYAQHDFASPQVVEACEVYWHVDHAAAVKLPAFWKVLYLDDSGFWMPVGATPAQPTADRWNEVRFTPCRTKALRLLVQLDWESTAGFLEWKTAASSASPGAPHHPEELWLDEQFPISGEVGTPGYRVNRYNNTMEAKGTQILLDGQPCHRYLFAPAQSALKFNVPIGYTRFSAIAMGPQWAGKRGNYTWNYSVLANDQPLFDGPSLSVSPGKRYSVDVALPPGTKTITLLTKTNNGTVLDHSIWAHPRLSAARADGTAVGTLGETAFAPGQPDPRTDFKGWLKTVQFRFGNGDSFIWAFDEGVLLHYGQKDPKSKVQRFEVISIDPETRTVSWKPPVREAAMRIDPQFKHFEFKGDSGFSPQACPIEPRNQAIFGAPTSTARKGGETLVRLQQLEAEFQTAGAGAAKSAHDKAMTDLRTKYAAAVSRAQEEAKKAGDSTTSDALQEELSRAQVGADVPEKDDPAAPAALAKLRTIYREQAATAAKSHAARIKPLLDRYDAELAALEASLTGESDDLAAVKAARAKIGKQR